MTKLQFIATFLRIAGAYILLSDLWLFSLQILKYVGLLFGDTDLSLVFVLILFSSKLVLGLILLLLPMEVARKIVPGPDMDDECDKEQNLTLSDLQVLAFGVLGVYWITSSLIALMPPIYSGINHQMLFSNGSNLEFFLIYAGHIAGLIIGLWLLLGAKGLFKAVRWLRSAGQ